MGSTHTFFKDMIPSLGFTSGRTDKNLCRCFGAPACRVLLIT